MQNVHVVPSAIGWQVKEASTGIVLATFTTQAEATAYATRIAQMRKKEVFIHRPNGQIRERNTFGKDPFPPKG
jgi:hypothetical protein